MILSRCSKVLATFLTPNHAQEKCQRLLATYLAPFPGRATRLWSVLLFRVSFKKQTALFDMGAVYLDSQLFAIEIIIVPSSRIRALEMAAFGSPSGHRPQQPPPFG